MSTTRPESLDDWANYIAGLRGEDLRSKARAVNTIDFVEDLMSDGFTADDVETLFILLARHLERSGLMLPDAGLYSYRRMAQRAPPVDVALPEAYDGAPVPDETDALERVDD